MEIKDYITKNLINLNWNILPQIFEENDAELTEEIEAYLRNTPENTNWNVFEGMIGSGEEEIIFNGVSQVYSMGVPTAMNEYDGREINVGDQFKVIINESIYDFTMEIQGNPTIYSENGELGFSNMVSNPPYTWLFKSNDLQVGEIQIKIVRTKKV